MYQTSVWSIDAPGQDGYPRASDTD